MASPSVMQQPVQVRLFFASAQKPPLIEGLKRDYGASRVFVPYLKSSVPADVHEKFDKAKLDAIRAFSRFKRPEAKQMLWDAIHILQPSLEAREGKLAGIIGDYLATSRASGETIIIILDKSDALVQSRLHAHLPSGFGIAWPAIEGEGRLTQFQDALLNIRVGIAQGLEFASDRMQGLLQHFFDIHYTR